MWFPTRIQAVAHPMFDYGANVSDPDIAFVDLSAPPPPAPLNEVRLLEKEEIVAHVSPTHYPKRTFHDYSENGDDALYFLRPNLDLKRADTSNLVERIVSFNDGHEPEMYYLYTGNDFRNLYLNFNRTGTVNRLIIPDVLSQKADLMLLQYSLVGRHMRMMWSKKEEESRRILNRSFPKEYVANQIALRSFGDSVNQFLNTKMTPNAASILSKFVPEMYQYNTIGQALYLLLLTNYMRTGKSKNTKLFIFALCVLISGEENLSFVHLTNLCVWITRDTCNSCFEKGLFAEFDVSYQYSLMNFEYSEREITLSQDADLMYRILEHEDATSEHYPAALYVHEHSFVAMKSKRSTLRFFVGKGEDRVEIETNVHRGTAIILALDGIVRVSRSRLHGEDFHLFDRWIVKHKMHFRGFEKLKELISDIVMCGVYHPQLLRLSKTLCFCLLFGVVPERLYQGYGKGMDLYAVVLSRISRGSNTFVDAMVKPCFDCGVCIDALQEQLSRIPFEKYYRLRDDRCV